MVKKRKFKGMGAIMHHWVKPALKATTHVLTVAGVVVAASPVIPGVKAAATGNITGAGQLIRDETIGSSTLVVDNITTAISRVAIPLLVGIGLVWAGGQLRKRVGN